MSLLRHLADCTLYSLCLTGLALLSLGNTGCGAAPSDSPTPEASTSPGTHVAALDTTVTLTAIADSHATAFAPSTPQGALQEVAVDRGNSHIYLRFDLSSLPANAHVKSVSLSADAFAGFAYGGDGYVYTMFVPDDSWSEATLTWNNKPPVSGDTLGEWFLWYDNALVDKLGVNSSAALIPVVQGELDGDKLLSVRLHSPGYKTRYRSREYADAARRPRLTVTYDVVVENVVTTVEPQADAHVYNDPSYLDTSWPWAQEMPISLTQSAFLRFSLASIPAGAVITSVKLSATSKFGYSPGGDGSVYTYLVPSNAWMETTLTYRNQPPTSGAALGSWLVWYPNSTWLDRVGVNASPDLVPAVQNASNAVDRRISFKLMCSGYTGYYYAREVADAAKRPKLEVTYYVP